MLTNYIINSLCYRTPREAKRILGIDLIIQIAYRLEIDLSNIEANDDIGITSFIQMHKHTRLLEVFYRTCFTGNCTQYHQGLDALEIQLLCRMFGIREGYDKRKDIAMHALLKGVLPIRDPEARKQYITEIKEHHYE